MGALRDRQSDFRVVSATNVDLELLVERRDFREDLAERLSAVTIEVPSLAARRDDIPQLVAHFAAAATIGTGRTVQFSADALALLQVQEWPRNVRQLRHVVERAIALHDGPLLGAVAIDSVLWRPGQARPADRAGALARTTLSALLEAASWDTARVAEALGVNRTTVYRRMQRLGITVPTRNASEAGCNH